MNHARANRIRLRHVPAIPYVVLHLLLPFSASSALAQVDEVEQPPSSRSSTSVVKVHVSSARPDIFLPWKRGEPRRSTGSAVYIGDGLFLTNAHVVAHAEGVLLESQTFTQRLVASVVHADYAADLAVVSCDNPELLIGLTAVDLSADLPDVGAPVDVIGYAQGGNSSSTTSGVVSRVAYAPYYYGHSGFRIQVDAALNPGNSGGPAFVHDKAIGIAMGHMVGGENVGYVIPSLEIDRFLERATEGDAGQPLRRGLDVRWQAVESAAMRQFLKLPPTLNGAVIVDPRHDSALQQHDVVLSVNDMALDSQGNCRLHGVRVDWLAAIDQLGQDNKTVSLEVFRSGEKLNVTASLSDKTPDLFAHDPDGMTEYFVYGPFVFIGGTLEHARLLKSPEWTADLIRRESPLVTRRYDKVRFESEQVVMLGASPFPNPSTDSYQGLRVGTQLMAVNDQPVQNLKHVFDLLQDNEAEFVVLKFSGHEADSVVVVDSAEMIAVTDAIKRRHSIVESASASLITK